MATAIGQRYLVRYYEADDQNRQDLRPQLDICLARKYVTQAEHDHALSGEPPEGYVAPLTAGAPTAEVSDTGASTAPDTTL